jgi:L-arabinokinase
MGGIADYSGSLVLELPLREETRVSIRREESGSLNLESRRSSGETSRFTMPVAALDRSYEDSRAYFQRSWPAYVAGVFVVLAREKGAAFRDGAHIRIESTVPEGKGVASSAALEVASMRAVDAAYGLGLAPLEIALLSQRVENSIVGAPCGVMDQMTAVFGEPDRLLALLCQPAELLENVAVPEGLSFWGIDSGIAHRVSGADYGSVRVGTFIGYRMLREMAGNDFQGYLANLAPSELEQKYLHRLPETIRGIEFLDRFGKTSDAATRVDPERIYPVRRATAHPVHEHFRVRSFLQLLQSGGVSSAPLLGELMFQSHASYSACGLGSEGTDRLVELARAIGPSRGIYGAKITGGGSGGTVAFLGRSDAEPAIEEIADSYASETGHSPHVFTGSTRGAATSARHSSLRDPGSPS